MFKRQSLPKYSFFNIYLFIYIFRQRGREEEKRERNINVWLLLVHSLLETRLATQAHALTGNQTSDPLVCRSVLNPLSHTSQGSKYSLFDTIYLLRHFFYYSRQFLNSSILMLFSVSVLFCFTCFTLVRHFPLRTFFIQRNKKLLYVPLGE